MDVPFVKIQREDFDIGTEIERLTSNNQNVGAVVTFSGKCRSEGGRLTSLELEHYPGMAEAQVLEIAKEAKARFQLDGILAIHRYGKIKPGENIVLVIASSAHRQAAFDGANYLMDYLKTNAPFWKKEHLANGKNGEWISAQDSDSNALSKWDGHKEK